MRSRHDPRLVPENSFFLGLLDKRGPRLQLVRLNQGARASGGRALTGSLPAVFRDVTSGLIRVIDRELVIRFRPSLSAKLRRSILSSYGFVSCRRNPFIPEQLVVFQPSGRASGEELIGISNELAQLEEVALVTPNFLSEYRRQIPPSVLPAEWHLRNVGGRGAKKGEDIGIDEAWKVTTGRREIVVAVLDDGVDMDHPIAALVLSVHPALSRQELKDLLAATADKIGNGYDACGHSDEMGFGRINAGKAVEEALKRVR